MSNCFGSHHYCKGLPNPHRHCVECKCAKLRSKTECINGSSYCKGPSNPDSFCSGCRDYNNSRAPNMRPKYIDDDKTTCNMSDGCRFFCIGLIYTAKAGYYVSRKVYNVCANPKNQEFVKDTACDIYGCTVIVKDVSCKIVKRNVHSYWVRNIEKMEISKRSEIHKERLIYMKRLKEFIGYETSVVGTNIFSDEIDDWTLIDRFPDE